MIKTDEIRDFIKEILKGYSQIYFSKNIYVGLIFFLATMIIPFHGISGLIGMILSNVFAYYIGFEREKIKQGFFAYNGLLISLALGLTYRFNKEFVIMLVIANLLGVIVSSAILTISEKYFNVSVLSLPFVISSWIIIAAGQKFQGLIYTTRPFEIDYLNSVFPKFFEFYFKSLGAAFFQVNMISGILVAIGILIFSRHAFILASISLVFGYFFHYILGGSMVDIQKNFIGFNFALTAIAVGGMFVIPRIDSLILTIFATFITLIVSSGISIILSILDLPILASPFLFTTILILYTLKNRVNPKHFLNIDIPNETPEKNIKAYKNSKLREFDLSLPMFQSPVLGNWKITQSFNGELTHKDNWIHALDYEVVDEKDSTFKGQGNYKEDYYAWNMPVFVPMDGKVVKVENSIDDNDIGQLDSVKNWGNTVVIWHYGSIYSSYSHLQKNSITVSEGDEVKKGKIIGKVGNSGRSPYPHLHFQVQYLSVIGSYTTDFRMMNYAILKDKNWIYKSNGVPKKDEVIKNVISESNMYESASFPVGKKLKYSIKSNNKEWKENWETEIDFYSNRYLVCKEKNAKIKLHVDKNSLTQIDYIGKKNCSMKWFFYAASKIPFTKDSVYWKEKLQPDNLLNNFQKIVYDILEPIVSIYELNTESEIINSNSNGFTVKTNLVMNNRILKKRLRKIEIVSYYEKYKGLYSLIVKEKDKKTFEMFLEG